MAVSIKEAEEALGSKKKRYAENRAYVNGKNPEILEEPKGESPDNRIPVPFGKMAVTDMHGYAGRAGDIGVEVLGDNKNYEEAFKVSMRGNQHHIVTSEVYEEMLVQGEAYEIVWTSKRLDLKTNTPEFAMVPGEQMFLEYSDSLRPELVSAVRIWKNNGIKKAAHYKEGGVLFFVKNNDEWVLTKEEETLFKSIPVVRYCSGRSPEALFEAEKPLIKAFDGMLSRSVNEVDRFNDLIALMPAEVTKEFVDKLKKIKVIDDLGQYEKWPSYLQKDLTKVSPFYSEIFSIIERLFHKSIKIPDMSDNSFAGNQSGIALAYKLLPMEFSAAKIDLYFDRGLEYRSKLIEEVLSSGYGVPDGYLVKHKRNLPVDEETKVNIAKALIGIVSDETLLKILPKTIVEDAKTEAEKKKKEDLEEEKRINGIA